ncbi:MAG: polyprenyl synthetase family protein [Deltaproteobacteria bacterium]|nr:MAG: polyprenyl synthetase family protein [Deltaproteobacteria bacterium]RLB23655.1 MAG: polyprenyl synthetase family protein [Deltaproteobacteria bacterium]HDH87309.1 polyprenyl synthetase family protein [Desulfobacteraceae bacterium]
MKIEQYLDERKTLVDKALQKFMPRPSGLASDVINAMNYSLFAGGKRVRPILCMAGAEAVGGSTDSVVPVACAIELIHTYSLIHDDLPVMDNDDLRRGKPTNHKVFGEAVALLAGDGLLTLAFNLMAGYGAEKEVEKKALLRVIDLIASAAGYKGMVGGQVVDITYEGKEPDPSVVEYIHRHKTAALIAASVTAGTILAGGNKDEEKSINRYGQQIGLAFQIADDILNIQGDRKIMGKGTGSDKEKGKITYPSVFGTAESTKIQKELIKNAIESLKGFDNRAEPLRDLARYIINRKL